MNSSSFMSITFLPAKFRGDLPSVPAESRLPWGQDDQGKINCATKRQGL